MNRLPIEVAKSCLYYSLYRLRTLFVLLLHYHTCAKIINIVMDHVYTAAITMSKPILTVTALTLVLDKRRLRSILLATRRPHVLFCILSYTKVKNNFCYSKSKVNILLSIMGKTKNRVHFIATWPYSP